MINNQICSRQMKSITLFYPNLLYPVSNSQLLYYPLSHHGQTGYTILNGSYFHPSNLYLDSQERRMSRSTTDGSKRTSYLFSACASSFNPISMIRKSPWSVWAFFLGGCKEVVILQNRDVFLSWLGHGSILWLLMPHLTHCPSFLLLFSFSTGIYSFCSSPLLSDPPLQCNL